MNTKRANYQSKATVFKIEKTAFSYIFFGLYIAYLLVFSYAIVYNDLNWSRLWPNLFLVPICIINIWDFYTAKYILSGNILKSKTLFLTSEIDINSISEIKKDAFVFLKPGVYFAGKAILIKYGRNRELAVNPQSSSEFIEKLLKLNPGIIVAEA